MSGENGNSCKVCGNVMLTEREQNMLVCFECRRYGLLNGCWPAHDLSKTAEAVKVQAAGGHVD